MKILKISLFILVFLLGWVLHSSLIQSELNLENPSLTGIIPVERDSPADRLTKDNIQFYPNRVIIDFNGVSGTKYTNTNSMDPTLDEDTIGLEIPVTGDTKLKVGDIVAYEDSQSGNLFVHRIKKVISEGKLYIVGADNIKFFGNEIVSHDRIKYVSIGLLY
ncbi:MAG TPA: hypothetical protein VJC07_02205 [Candidatus Nanoarchaeia archaeon]|nr:hypothetical protein [Candidatus Nanoarchaeia archaeon]